MISNVAMESELADDDGAGLLLLPAPPPRVEKFHLPAPLRRRTISGRSTIKEVTSRRREKISGHKRNPTLTADACRKGPLLKAGSSAIEILSAEAPPLKTEADSLPMCTSRLSAVVSRFSRSGRKVSTLTNRGRATAAITRTPRIIPPMSNRRRIRKCYQTQNPLEDAPL